MEIKEQTIYIVDNVQFTDKDEAINFAAKYEKVDNSQPYYVRNETEAFETLNEYN